MEAVCVMCGMELEARQNPLRVSVERVVRKHTYVLPSGRKIKVVVDNDTEPARVQAEPLD